MPKMSLDFHGSNSWASFLCKKTRKTQSLLMILVPKCPQEIAAAICDKIRSNLRGIRVIFADFYWDGLCGLPLLDMVAVEKAGKREFVEHLAADGGENKTRKGRTKLPGEKSPI